jgi:tRNA G18 (ribose-2'-O)-methylase SpoU
VCFCGHTPTPIDRFGRKRADLGKVAIGAEDAFVWTHVDTTEEAVLTLQKEGARVVALEQDAGSIPYTSFTHDGVVALVLGEEVHGIPHDILALCDTVVEIPMHGKKESLNVSVAAGIVIFRLVEQGA